MSRYFRLYSAFARFSFTRELMFRGNFVAKMSVELLWVVLMLVFYKTIFRQTSMVAGWRTMDASRRQGCSPP